MSVSRAFDQFLISLVAQADAAITLEEVTVGLRPGFVSIYAWAVRFTYVTGFPAATAFQLSSADGLTGTFSPPQPTGIGSRVRSGRLEGTVQRIPGVEGDIDYEGTITVIQI